LSATCTLILYSLGLKQNFTCEWIHSFQVFLNKKCEIVQKLFILKLEPDLDPEPEKLSEYGAS